MLISVITNNLEVAFNITTQDIKVLDKVDIQLLRQGLNLSSKASRCLILLSFGVCSVEYIIKQKRVKYLYYLLTKPRNTLASQIFEQMRIDPSKSDWINVALKDLQDLNINLSLAQISEMSKYQFKKWLRFRPKMHVLNPF